MSSLSDVPKGYAHHFGTWPRLHATWPFVSSFDPSFCLSIVSPDHTSSADDYHHGDRGASRTSVRRGSIRNVASPHRSIRVAILGCRPPNRRHQGGTTTGFWCWAMQTWAIRNLAKHLSRADLHRPHTSGTDSPIIYRASLRLLHGMIGRSSWLFARYRQADHIVRLSMTASIADGKALAGLSIIHTDIQPHITIFMRR